MQKARLRRMRAFWNNYKFVCIAYALWRITLGLAALLSVKFIPLRVGFLGAIPWSNMDGVHYIEIAKHGYFQYGEAFFPLYPFLIRMLATYTFFSYEAAGLLISHIGFLAGLLLLYRMIVRHSKALARWTIVFLLAFPTAFFYAAVYTEGLFFFLIVASVALAKEKRWFAAGICGALAAATRVVGITTLVLVAWEYWQNKPKRIRLSDIASIAIIPLGLLCYMWYLYRMTGDPFMFFHVQPMYGANRSGNAIIFLPQVFWRYGKIIFTAFLKPTAESYVVSVFECLFTIGAYVLLYIGWRSKEKMSYLIYAICVLTIPTFTGTLSSMPRYIVSVFPLFIVLGRLVPTSFKVTLVVLFGILQMVAAMVYLRGWFVA